LFIIFINFIFSLRSLFNYSTYDKLAFGKSMQRPGVQKGLRNKHRQQKLFALKEEKQNLYK